MLLRLTFCVLFSLAPWLSLGEPPAGYYDSTQEKTGHDLRVALHIIIKNHTVIPYSSGSRVDTSDALKELDEDPANTNNVILVYAQRSEPKTNFALSTGWNREHMWPNSYGLDGVEPAYSDLFNLRPEDENVNSARGNKLYDRSDTNSPSYRFPAHTEAPACSTDNDSWEPPANVKGDIARAMFYMDVRYEGDVAGELDLILTDQTNQVDSLTNLMARLTTLILWHYADPVNDVERRRNDLVYERYQRNRNPFIDHPEWVREVFHPVLLIRREAQQFRLSWPALYQNEVLESVSSVTGTWSTIAVTPTLTNGEWVVFRPLNGPAAFYRLRLE